MHSAKCIFIVIILFNTFQGYGLGGLDHYDGYVQYKLLDESALSFEIGQMMTLIEADYKHFHCKQVGNHNYMDIIMSK